MHFPIVVKQIETTVIETCATNSGNEFLQGYSISRRIIPSVNANFHAALVLPQHEVVTLLAKACGLVDTHAKTLLFAAHSKLDPPAPLGPVFGLCL